MIIYFIIFKRCILILNRLFNDCIYIGDLMNKENEFYCNDIKSSKNFREN